MSESPSVYLPRQLRPRRISGSEDQGTQRLRASDGTRNERMYSLRRESTGMARTTVAKQESVHIADTDYAAHAVSISAFLGRQICELASNVESPRAEPTICAYLLGYIESDGSIQLNRLDQGILVDGTRVPTAVYSTDTVIPLYQGLSRDGFYSKALKPGHIFKAAAWLTQSGANGHNAAIEFISTSCDVRVSIEPASAIDISSLPELLAHIRHSSARHGPLRRQECGTYLHDNGPLLPPERTIWAVCGSETDNSTIKSAYVDAGLPRSLHVAQIIVEDGGRSALVQHSLVAPLAGTFSVNVRLAATDVASSSPATNTAMFVSVAQYGCGALRVIHNVADQHRIEICDGATTVATPRVSKCQPSPLLDKIVASTRALVSPQIQNTTVLRSPVVRPTSEANGIVELLKEQRHIRSLLEEQNSLLKTHVSQTQELVRMARHQPSPQTVTRRYLRMKGTHTPTLTNVHRRTSDAGRAIVDSAESTNTQGMRRSTSLSEIVDDIRSFEVEGYEETEHNPRHDPRLHLIASPLYGGSNKHAIESPTQTQLSTVGSSSALSSINSLVTRINRLASDDRHTAPVPRGAFERPPLPAYTQAQERNHSHGSK
ncbi:hypothetical protein GGH98_004307, partial [Coemansia sp. RSA 454]